MIKTLSIKQISLVKELFPNSIKDLIKILKDVFIPDFEKGMIFNFEIIPKSSIGKEILRIQYATLENAKEITEIFKDAYDGTYPYKEMEDPITVRKMILDSTFKWIIFKNKLKEIVGCYGFRINIKRKSGTFHGFAIKQNYRGKVDIVKVFLGCTYSIISEYRDRILVWSCEMRTAHSISQYMGLVSGLKPIAFCPNKDVFFNHVESTFLVIIYDENTLRLFRSKQYPKIILEVANCYLYSKIKYNLGNVSFKNPELYLDQKKIANFAKRILKKIETYKNSRKIITLSIKNTNSFFKFLYNFQSQHIEKTKYKVKNFEELQVFIMELQKFVKKFNIRYVECFISAYKPFHQKIFYNAGFRPRGYVPCWRYNEKKNVFEDYILFNYYYGKIDKDIKLIPESLNLLKIL